ncbi:MAG: lipopolysaccharide heptosyltransferase II [Pseudomonadota bacterium]
MRTLDRHNRVDAYPAAVSTSGWLACRRVLAVRLDSLGDVIMTTPALAALRHALPHARITLLTSSAATTLAPCLSVVDDVMGFDAAWVQKTQPVGEPPGERERALIEQLRTECFDAAVIFTVCTQSALPAALMCQLAGIPLRLAHCRENPYGLLTHWVPDPDVIEPGMRHETRRQMDLVASVGFVPPSERLSLRRHEAAEQHALAEKLSRAGLDLERPMVVVHPGARASSRRYPPERFGIAARMVAERTGHAIVFTGEVCEHEWIEAARAEMGLPSVSLAGELTLSDMVALVSQARVLLSNNSGPVHIAAAVQTPVVVLYALTNPQHTPWQVRSVVLNHDVPCRNCLKSVCPQGHHACLREVAPEQVCEAVLSLLGPAAVAPLPASLQAGPSMETTEVVE